MSESPKVSVIIPTYSRAGLLPRSVNSVLAQTYADLELLIVDDCSTDDTPQVIAAFTDPRVRSFRHNVNRGQSAAINTGLANARGEYCALLDCDDELTPNSIAARLAALESAPQQVALAYGYVDAVDDATGERWPSSRRALQYAEAFEFALRMHDALTGPLGMFFRTSAAREIGGFDERLPSGSDGFFVTSLLAKYQAVAVREVIAVHHDRHGYPQVTDTYDWSTTLRHLELHKQRFSAEIAQRPGLLQYLERWARLEPARRNRSKALVAARNGAPLTALRSAAQAFKDDPISSESLRLPLHMLKGFLFYASPLRRFRRPLQRLLGQHNR